MAIKGSPVGPADQVVGLGLGMGRGVREREDHRPLHLAGHLADDRLGERAGDCREADQDGRLDPTDHVRQPDVAVRRPRPVRHALGRLGVHALVGRSGPCGPRGAGRPCPPARTGPRLGLREAILHQRRPQVVGNADGGRAGAEEHDMLVAEPLAGHTHCPEDRAQGDRRCPLDVVVEGQ